MINTLRFIAIGLGLAAALHDAPAKELKLDELFPKDRLLEVKITLSEADWDKIRYQRRTRENALPPSRKFEPPPPPYSYVEASVTIDGVTYPKVGLRKKGFLGSQDTTRPSLKVKLDYSDKKGHIDGLRNLTFNNNRQDASLVSQFMGYEFWDAAGAPGSRCAFAKVTVNGRNLGVYCHVETVREPLLRREFGSDKGTLFEGTVVDFYPEWEGSFERKTGDDKKGRERTSSRSSRRYRVERKAVFRRRRAGARLGAGQRRARCRVAQADLRRLKLDRRHQRRRLRSRRGV